MRTTSSIAFFCRKSKANKQGYSPLECSVTICGSRKFFNLPQKFKPEEFNKRKPAQEIVECMDLWRTRINTYMTQMLKEGLIITASSLRETIQQGGVARYTVGKLFSEYLSILRQRVGTDLKDTVYRKYELAAEKVLKIADKDADVTTLTPAVIKSVETALKAQYDAATVAGYLTRIKSFTKYGQDIGKLSFNPFVGIHIRKPIKPIKHLTEEQVMDLLGRSYKGSLQRALDLFLISCGTGMAYSDLMDFKIEDLHKEGDFYYISKRRNKTGRVFNAVVLDFAIPIIFHYQVLPKMCNQVYNRKLKAISSTLTSHMGRRTYATLLYNKSVTKGVSLDVVAAALGDTPAIAARYYAKLLDKTVIEQQINVLKM